jgi:hypothetical protein
MPCLDQGNVANVSEDAPVIRQYFEYICVHGWTLSIGILVCHRLSVSDQFQGANSKGPHPMPIRASGRAGLVQALVFKCIICNTEFASQRAADCHCRHPASCGAACADPSNMQSLSLTARSNVSGGLLRQHSAAPLGTRIISHRK